MEKAQSNTKNKLKALIDQFGVASMEESLALVPKFREEGNASAVKALIDKMNEFNGSALSDAIYSILIDIKDQEMAEVIMNGIRSDLYPNIRSVLISIFWQSSLDASEYLSELVKEACKGDFHITLEVLTVIENFDSSFDEQEIMDCIYEIDDALMEQPGNELLESLKSVINKLSVD